MAIKAQGANLTIAIGAADRENAIALTVELKAVANDLAVDARAARGEGELVGTGLQAAVGPLQGAAIQVDHQTQASFDAGLELGLGAAVEVQLAHIDGQVERQRGRRVGLLEPDRNQETAVDRVKTDAGAKGQDPGAVERVDELLQGANRLAFLMHNSLKSSQSEGQAALHGHRGAIKHLGDRVRTQDHLPTQHRLAEGDLLAEVGGPKTAASQFHHRGERGVAGAAKGLTAGGNAVETG